MMLKIYISVKSKCSNVFFISLNDCILNEQICFEYLFWSFCQKKLLLPRKLVL